MMMNHPDSQLLFVGTIHFSHPSPVIGRGGEQITRIQLESGCKIQIAAGESLTFLRRGASVSDVM